MCCKECCEYSLCLFFIASIAEVLEFRRDMDLTKFPSLTKPGNDLWWAFKQCSFHIDPLVWRFAARVRNPQGTNACSAARNSY